jgi:hypothetical protein
VLSTDHAFVNSTSTKENIMKNRLPSCIDNVFNAAILTVAMVMIVSAALGSLPDTPAQTARLEKPAALTVIASVTPVRGQ